MKEIPLTQGYIALVDDEDYEMLRRLKWQIKKTKNLLYAATALKTNDKWSTFYMHRIIMSVLPGFEIDHINHNGLDNRKSNLRFCTRFQNNQNCRKKKGTMSKYKGVTYQAGKWIARIKQRYLGCFNSEQVAALAYNQAARSLFKNFANVNNIADNAKTEAIHE